MTLFVDVAFPRPLLRSYTYAIPAALSGRVRPGVRVRASLGRQTAVGVAVRVHDEPPAGEAAVKEIAAVLDEAPALPLPILAFTRKLAAEQAAGWGALLGLALPPDPAPPLKRRAAEKGRVEVEQLELDLASAGLSIIPAMSSFCCPTSPGRGICAPVFKRPWGRRPRFSTDR